jgi:hypothetical protein
MLGTVAPRAACEEAPAADLDAEALQDARQRLAKSLDKSLARVAEAVAGHVLGLLRVKPVAESDLASPTNGMLDRLLLRALLRYGVLAKDVEATIAIPPVYAHGKLSYKSRITDEQIARLRGELGIAVTLEAQWAEVDGRYDVRFRLRELGRGHTMKKWHLSRIDTRRVPLSDILEIRPLPDVNLAILLFAIRMLGHRVDGGECWDVPAHPLRARGFTPKGYVFGRRTSFEDALPGDVVTIDARGHHHVMVLWQKGPSLGESTILHQNWSGKRHVMIMGYPGHMVQDAIIWRPGV